MILSRNAVQQIIREYAERLRDAGISIHEVYLFGSRAQGDQREWSDIDLCIVSPQFGRDRQEEMSQLVRIASTMDTPVPIEPIPFAPDDLDDRWSTLAGEIRERGIRAEV